MAKLEEDYVVIDSPLSGELRRDGITIDVQIYRGDEDETWVLEVVDSENASHLWDDQFSTYQAAMDELIRTIQREGMKQFSPHQQSELN